MKKILIYVLLCFFMTATDCFAEEWLKYAVVLPHTGSNEADRQRLKEFRVLLAKIALSYKGTPYVWGGNTPAGFDCSGT